MSSRAWYVRMYQIGPRWMRQTEMTTAIPARRETGPQDIGNSLRHLSRLRLWYLNLNRRSWQLLLKTVKEREILRRYQ